MASYKVTSSIQMLSKLGRSCVQNLIKQHTKLCRNHLTPELQLHLITPECPLWLADPKECPFTNPFWAFYWPGGQALARYILDNPELFEGRRVLDIGSGCGSAAIASRLVGAGTVVANDIDPDALSAIEMNMEANSTGSILLNEQNLLTKPSSQMFDVILLGDMFYDPDFAEMISDWLKSMASNAGTNTTVLIGDPGRFSFMSHPLRETMKLLREYKLSDTCALENNGFSHGAVWEHL